MREVSNRALLRVPKDALLVALVLSVSIFAFFLGMLAQRQLLGSGEGKGAFRVINTQETAGGVLGASVAGATQALVSESSGTSAQADTRATIGKPALQAGRYVASKNGTKYYLPSCSGAKRIKEENKIWFATIEDAKASGKTAATNCKGL